MKCIIYEGIFDPPHIGHYWLLQQAREDLEASAIVVIGNDNAARTLSNKPNVSPEKLRYKWCATSMTSIAGLRMSAHIFTVDIIKEIQATFNHKVDKWYYLMGPDKNLGQYKNNKIIRSIITPIYYNPNINIRSSMIRDRIRNNKLISGLLAPGLNTKEIYDYFNK